MLRLSLLLWLAPLGVSAQLPDPPTAPSEADAGVARDAFVEGISHAEHARWPRALEAFERSYRLSGSPVALFNLGSTLRSLGRVREAVLALDRLLADPALDAETRRRASRLRAEAAARVARLSVMGVPEGRADVLVDGRAREPTLERPVEVELDPGLRVVRVVVDRREAFTWSAEIGDGDHLDVEATPDDATPEPEPEPEPAGPPDWTPIAAALGALGALAVGALVLGLVLDAESQLAPRSGLVIELP